MNLRNGVLLKIDKDDLSRDGDLIIPEGVIELADDFIPNHIRVYLKSVSMPNSLKVVGDNSFTNTLIREITFPDSVTEIGKDALAYCPRLEYVKLPKNLQVISEGMFQDANVGKVIMPENLQIIGIYAFNRAKFSFELKLPNSLKRIETFAFANSDIEYLNIPEGVELIADGCFMDCKSLYGITLPPTLKKIKDEVFNGCEDLLSIEIPDNVTEVGERCFFDCKKLTSIKLSESLNIINDGLFASSGLTEIEIPNSVVEIKDSAFFNCKKLNDVQLSSSLRIINDRAFCNCSSLGEINFPASLTDIGSMSFYKCNQLNHVSIPSNVKNIGDNCFYECKNLLDVKIENGVETIGNTAFYECHNLKEIQLPESVKQIGTNCFPLENKNFVLSLFSTTKIGRSIFKRKIYLSQKENRQYISSKPEKEAIELSDRQQLNAGVILALMNIKDKVLHELEIYYISILYQTIYYELTPKQFLDFYNKADKKFVKKAYNSFISNLNANDKSLENVQAFFKLLYNLGGFEPAKIVEVINKNGSRTDRIYLAQKVNEFLIECLNTKILDPNDFSNLFGNMVLQGVKPDFTRLFLDKSNLKSIIEYAKSHSDNNKKFVVECYHDFEKIQDINKSNKGSQRQLKITFDMLVDYSKRKKFEGQTEENEKIAEVVARFFKKQESFDNAVKIMEEHKTLNISNSLTSRRIIEDDIFSTINNHILNFKQSEIETLGVLSELAEKEFTYEWLQKNDPYNLVLGKLCNCCSHLEGQGFGIMRASIIHPNIQNVVIKNKTGEIVAKSTLFINPEQGYGVFNTISVSNRVSENKLEMVYNKFRMAVIDFVHVYNAEHKNQQLKILTVGMNLNGLENLIKSNNKKSEVLYKSLYYGDYSLTQSTYEGDSFANQYIVWENDQYEK